MWLFTFVLVKNENKTAYRLYTSASFVQVFVSLVYATVGSLHGCDDWYCIIALDSFFLPLIHLFFKSKNRRAQAVLTDLDFVCGHRTLCYLSSHTQKHTQQCIHTASVHFMRIWSRQSHIVPTVLSQPQIHTHMCVCVCVYAHVCNGNLIAPL